MKAPAHLLIGAAAGVAPDVVLLAFGWRRRWLPDDHPLVRAHDFLHSPAGLVVPLLAGWASHLVADRWSWHGQGGPAPYRGRRRRR